MDIKINSDYINKLIDDEITLEDEIDLIRVNIQPAILLYGIDSNFEEVKLTLEGVK